MLLLTGHDEPGCFGADGSLDPGTAREAGRRAVGLTTTLKIFKRHQMKPRRGTTKTRPLEKGDDLFLD